MKDGAKVDWGVGKNVGGTETPVGREVYPVVEKVGGRENDVGCG